MKETVRIIATRPEQIVLLAVVVVAALFIFVHSHCFGL
jgi:hypothetical protein